MVQYDTNQTRLVIRGWAKGNLSELIKQNINKKNVNFIFELDNYQNGEIFDELLEALKQNNLQIEDCKFMIETPQDKSFTKQDWQLFQSFNSKLQKHGNELFFKEITVVWTMNEVTNANQKIQSTIEEIKEGRISINCSL